MIIKVITCHHETRCRATYLCDRITPPRSPSNSSLRRVTAYRPAILYLPRRDIRGYQRYFIAGQCISVFRSMSLSLFNLSAFFALLPRRCIALNAARLSPPSGQPRSSAMVHRRARPGSGEVVSPGLWARLSLPAVHAAVPNKGTAPAAAKRAVKLRRLISHSRSPRLRPYGLHAGAHTGESRRACDGAKMSAAPVVAP